MIRPIWEDAGAQPRPPVSSTHSNGETRAAPERFGKRMPVYFSCSRSRTPPRSRTGYVLLTQGIKLASLEAGGTLRREVVMQPLREDPHRAVILGAGRGGTAMIEL
ncbi:hypothetical protein D6779_07110, partial [Candidatus Parcubacteria bacterium]